MNVSIGRFSFNIPVTVFTVVFLVVFINLGFWQLRRADEKIVLLQEQAMLATEAPVDVSDLATTRDGRAVSLRGTWQPDLVFLLDNRVVNGVVGYEVLRLYGERYLVNLGFVAQGRTRADVPVMPPLIAVPEVNGKAYVREWGAAMPVEIAPGVHVIQDTNLDDIAKVAGVAVFGTVIRLDESNANALPRHWPVTVMLPEKHRGYAIQWFAMATALAALYIYFVIRSSAEDAGDENG